MAIFSSNKETSPQNVIKAASSDPISSIISKDMIVKGEVSFKGKTRIDGTVEGNILGEHLILSESAKVIGDLELISLVCHGVIEGNVQAQQVTTHSTATLHGNLVASNLTVESGTRLNGEITASSEKDPQKSSTAAATQRKKPAANKLETPPSIEEIVNNKNE